jgi:XTP/dITP diphosphohydrolase
VLADDSGLEITALGGSPGVHSARFGGEGSSYEEKIRMILDLLDGEEDRTARFACLIAVARPDGTIVATASGECRGEIARAPNGSNGFGYDPVFIPDGFDRTFGEMSDDEKRTLSHRARASEQIIRKMLDFIGV